MPLYLKVIHPSLLAEQKFRMNVMAVLAKPFDLLVKKKKRCKYLLSSILLPSQRIQRKDNRILFALYMHIRGSVLSDCGGNNVCVYDNRYDEADLEGRKACGSQ